MVMRPPVEPGACAHDAPVHAATADKTDTAPKARRLTGGKTMGIEERAYCCNATIVPQPPHGRIRVYPLGFLRTPVRAAARTLYR